MLHQDKDHLFVNGSIRSYKYLNELKGPLIVEGDLDIGRYDHPCQIE
jgi:hypothetical protein